jgi:hypothetical protein
MLTFEDQAPSGHLTGQFVDFRRRNPARAAPWGPEVHQDRNLGFTGDLGKLLRINLDWLGDRR